ncbi:MAG: chloride channel protein [Candidatus Cyclobacteriaceae bacterium M3_2C_046]
MRKRSFLVKFLIWRIKHVNDRNFIMILALIVGILVGLSATFLKFLVHVIQNVLTQSFTLSKYNFLYIIYPSLGILLVVLFIRYFVKQRVGHGIPLVLFAISRNNGNMKPHNIYSSIITSAITVAFGGSVGLEGPTVATGAAIGSNIGRILHLNYKKVLLLLGCASAGAMAAIFKAPIAAVIFALEVIMLDLTMSAIVPLLIASATAALISYLLLGQNIIYTFEVLESFKLDEIHFYLVFGIITALVSVYFTKMYMAITGRFDRFKRWYVKLLIGGFILGLLIFIFPALYGEGYDVINSALSGETSYLFNNTIFFDLRENFWVMWVLMLLVVLLKSIATSVTFGSGGIGGIFAPSLFMGSNLGLLFAKLMNFFKADISERNFALVGMAGLISGVIHAPLTAIFLIAEITGGYQLFMPLMLVATISYLTIKYIVPNSVYTIQLAKRGELITHHKDKAILSLMKIDKLIETDFKTIDVDATLGDLVELIKLSKRNVFPVLDQQRNLKGIVHLNNIRQVMFRPELYQNTYVRDLMHIPHNEVDPDDAMEDVAKQIQYSGHFNIPVVKNGKYIGFVSKANVFSSYRRMLRYFSED